METLVATRRESWLAWFLRGTLLLFSFILTARLIELTLIKGNYFHALAEGNRIKRIPILAPRGEILARGGEVLAGNLAITAPSQDFIQEQKRDYPFGSMAAHLIGYLGQVSPDEVGHVNGECIEKGVLTPQSLIGRMGLEEYYDCTLRGIDGEELVEIDTRGHKIRTLGRKSPIPGTDIKTTIDIAFQRKLSELLAGQKGAIIISDPEGQVLAFYSSPSFAPEAVADSLDDPDLPLFNRAVGGAYHPGSTFKIVTTTAALEEGKITRNYTYDDTGIIEVNDFSYTNWYFTQYGRTEGAINLVRALARSTDTFFYKAGEFVGANRLAFWADRFGLGQKTGLDLPGEVPGLVPTPAWKEKVKGEKWFLGNTYHLAIGQGDLSASPLQINTMTAVIANGGTLCQPHLLSAEPHCQNLGLKPETLTLIKEGLIAACSEGGTGYPFFDFVPQVACKTGTAETEEKDRTHAWFTMFLPADLPELVVTVLVEKGGEGSAVAAPIARKIADHWLVLKNP